MTVGFTISSPYMVIIPGGLGSACAILEVQVQFPDNAVCCCFLEQETSPTLLQLTQLYNGYLTLAGEGKAGPSWKLTLK